MMNWLWKRIIKRRHLHRVRFDQLKIGDVVRLKGTRWKVVMFKGPIHMPFSESTGCYQHVAQVRRLERSGVGRLLRDEETAEYGHIREDGGRVNMRRIG